MSKTLEQRLRDAKDELGRADPIETFHSVKGETHDVTVVVWPDTAPSKCPSRIWWPARGDDFEPRRIAYVALTRSRGEVVLCIPRPVRQRLAATRAEFVAAFEAMTVDEFAARQNVGCGPL